MITADLRNQLCLIKYNVDLMVYLKLNDGIELPYILIIAEGCNTGTSPMLEAWHGRSIVLCFGWSEANCSSRHKKCFIVLG